MKHTFTDQTGKAMFELKALGNFDIDEQDYEHIARILEIPAVPPKRNRHRQSFRWKRVPMFNDDFEARMETEGFGDDLPDRPDTWTGQIKGNQNQITEEEYGAISSRLERLMSSRVNEITRKNEEHEMISTLLLSVEQRENWFELSEWAWDHDEGITAVVKQGLRKWEDRWDVMWELLKLQKQPNYEWPSVLDGYNFLIAESRKLESIDPAFSGFTTVEDDLKSLQSWTEDMMKKDPDWVRLEREALDGTRLYLWLKTFRNDLEAFAASRRITISGNEIKKISPMLGNMYLILIENLEAGDAIKKQLVSTGRDKNVTTILISVEEFERYARIVTPQDLDLSYVCNPWSDDLFSHEVLERVKEAKKKIKIKD